MNLTDLQVELRNIEEQLSALHNEIDKMKPKSEDEKKTDFGTIDSLAARHTIFREEIEGMPYETKMAFFRSLSFTLLSTEKVIYARLLYMTRLCLGCGLNWKSEEIYKGGLEITDINSVVMEVKDHEYAFLVEAFIISNINMPADEKTLSMIADIANIMGCDSEELRVIAQVAKCKLVGDMDLLHDLPVPTKNKWMNKFRSYIPNEWIVKNRIECGRISTIEYKIAESCQAGSVVKSGNIICKYRDRFALGVLYSGIIKAFQMAAPFQESEDFVENTLSYKELTAPCDGIVFFMDDKRQGEDKDNPDEYDEYIVVYVVSYFDDFNDFTQWYKRNNQH